MGTILDAPVQILMGTNVRGAFTAEDNRDILDKLLGTAAPKTGARLPEVIEKRRSDMASQGMILPLVGYADDERLAPNQFLVTVALQTVTGDIRKDILFDMVVDMIKLFRFRIRVRRVYGHYWLGLLIIWLKRTIRNPWTVSGRCPTGALS